MASLNHFTVPVSMVLLCFLCVEIALSFRRTSAGRSRKCGIACCSGTAKSNAATLYLRRARKRPLFGAPIPFTASANPELSQGPRKTAFPNPARILKVSHPSDRHHLDREVRNRGTEPCPEGLTHDQAVGLTFPACGFLNSGNRPPSIGEPRSRSALTAHEPPNQGDHRGSKQSQSRRFRNGVNKHERKRAGNTVECECYSTLNWVVDVHRQRATSNEQVQTIT